MTNPQRLRLRDHLGHLKLCTARARLEPLLQDARAREVTYADFLDRLLSEAMRAKGEKAVAMHTVMARCPSRNPLERVDYGFHPSVDRKKLQALATGHVLYHGEHSVFLGPPGTGNTHLAMGLGLKAAQQGHRTLLTSALSRTATVTKAYAAHRFEDRLKLHTGPKLLMIDALGYLPIDRHGAHLFFQLISRRYERGAMILTADQSFGPWAEVFGAPSVAKAMLDRLLPHSHVINIQGDSDRLREQQKAGLLKKAPTLDAGYPCPRGSSPGHSSPVWGW